jgi:hypothetical protein
VVPSAIRTLVSSFGAGAAGLILIVSSVFSGNRITLFAIPAAAIALFLSRPEFASIAGIGPSIVPSALGAAVFGAGIIFGRR